MHALTMLHNILTESCSGIHAKRITSLFGHRRGGGIG